MFNILRKLAPSSSDSSQNSFGYPKIPSLVDWAVSTLISSIYNNIPFFYKKKIISKSENSKEKTKENNIVPSSQDSPLEHPPNKNLGQAAQNPNVEKNLSTDATTRLLPVVEFPKEPDKQFPQDYIKEILEIHNNPLTPIDLTSQSQGEFVNTHYDNEFIKFRTPTESPKDLIQLRQEWGALQRATCGENFDDIYYIRSTEERNSNMSLEALTTAYDDGIDQSYQEQQEGLKSPYTPYKYELRAILQNKVGLKNFALMFGLEYSFITKRGRESLGQDGYCSYYEPNISTLNSAKKFLSEKPHTDCLIKVPLIHLVIEKGILPEVEFLLTLDNVNCTSYQGINLHRYIPQLREKNDPESNKLSWSSALIILDTPLKIAIDKFDSQAVEILLKHGADPNIFIRPRLTYYISDQKDNNKVESQITLSNYLLTIEPKSTQETDAYIKIASSLYKHLQDQDKYAFHEQAAKKSLLISSESPGADEKKLLSDYLTPYAVIKSARTTSDNPAPSIPEAAKAIEPRKTEIPELKNPGPNLDSVNLPPSPISITLDPLAFLDKQASNTQNTLPDNILQLLGLTSDNSGHCYDIKSLLRGGTPIDNIAADNIQMLAIKY